MRRPFWRAQSQTWVFKLPGGQVKTLGKDEHGEGKKHPPKHIEEKWIRLRSRAGEDDGGAPKDMPLTEVFSLYQDYLKNPRTRRNTKEHHDWFLAHVGKGLKSSKLRVHHITEYLDKKDWSPTMKATAMERIKTAVNWAASQEYIDKRYKLEIPKSLRPNAQAPQTHPHAGAAGEGGEGRQPVHAGHPEGASAFGARPGELCGALIEKCDLKDGVLMVLNKTRNSTDMEYRPLYLSAQMVELLRGVIGKRKSGPIFTKPNGKPWDADYLGHIFYRLKVKLGLPEKSCVYVIRHGFASNALNRSDVKVNPLHLARIMGHQDLSMLLKVYFKEDPEAMRKAVDEATRTPGDSATVPGAVPQDRDGR